VAKASLTTRKCLSLQQSQRSVVNVREPYRMPDQVASDRIDRRALGKVSVNLAGIPCEQLFNAAAVPVVLIEAALGRIIDANPAAASLLGTPRHALVGTKFLSCVHSFSRKALAASVDTAFRAGCARPIVVRARHAGAHLNVSLSMVVVPSNCYLIARLAGAVDRVNAIPSLVLKAIESGPMGFLVADTALHIQYANRSFIDMLECASLEDLCGKSLRQWVELSQEDIAQLRAQMAQRLAVSVLMATLRSQRALTRDVELHAVAVPDEHNPRWAFIVRPQSRLN
jgi:PAS domain-containing protein